MYSVIKQFCPDCCLTICLSKVVTPTPVVPLVLFTVQFFYHSLGLHTAPVTRSLFRPHHVFIANLQWTFQALNISFSFQCLFFHIGFISRPVTKKQNLVGHGHGQGSGPFFVRFFPGHICSCCWILTVASTFLVSSWNSSAVAWAAPSFVLLQSMCHSDNFQTAVAAATSQAKLCTYNEEETAIYFRLIEAQFAAVGNKSQKLNYANALASLPKQVLQDILDTVNVYNESDQPFHILNCSDSPWRCRASCLASSWGSSSSIFRTVSAQTTILFSQCFWFDCRLPCEKQLVPETKRKPRLWLEP